MIQEAARGGPAACTAPRRAAGRRLPSLRLASCPGSRRWTCSQHCMHAASRRALGYSTAAAFTASNFFIGGCVQQFHWTTRATQRASEQMRSADELVNAHILPLVFLVSAFSISAAHEPCTPAVLPLLFYQPLSSGLLLLPRASNWPRLLNCLRPSRRRPTLMHRPANQYGRCIPACWHGRRRRPVGSTHSPIEAQSSSTW